MSSNDLCKACTLLEGLERGMAKSGIVRPLLLLLGLRHLSLCSFRLTEAESS